MESQHLQPDPNAPETLDRNLTELLQELRVVQTGVQILTGFLLTVPFSTGFASLTQFQRHSYLVVISGAVVTTALVVAPAAFHRVLFRHGRRRWIVEASNKFARAGLTMLGLTVSGVVFLVFDVVAGHVAAAVGGLVALCFLGGCWLVVPLTAPHRR